MKPMKPMKSMKPMKPMKRRQTESQGRSWPKPIMQVILVYGKGTQTNNASHPGMWKRRQTESQGKS